jgi:hypothetical protein
MPTAALADLFVGARRTSLVLDTQQESKVAEYVPFEAGIEVNGQTVYSVVDGFGTFRRVAEKFLADEKIGAFDASKRWSIEAEGWYSQAGWLRAFRRIAEDVGQSVLYDIGYRIPKNAQFPDFVRDVPSAIQSIDIAYHMNHRKAGQVMFDPQSGQMLEGIGHYGFEQRPGENRITSACRNPYPCSFDRGIVTAMAERFSRTARVEHAQGECRRDGGDVCTYVVTWR